MLGQENMNKLIILVFGLLSGCTQLMHGQMQPVKMISSKGAYLTSCSGAVENWNDCYDKASATCGGNYSILSKEDNSLGTKRELTFQCKK